MFPSSSGDAPLGFTMTASNASGLSQTFGNIQAREDL
jgi:hypothetical protein